MPHIRMFNSYDKGFGIHAGHNLDKRTLRKKIQHGVFGLIRSPAGNYIKEASKQGHEYDDKAGLRVGEIEGVLHDLE